MKLTVKKPLAYVWLVLFLASWLVSCSEDAELSAEEKVRKLLTSDTWTPASTGTSITLEGIDVQDELFPGFTLKFTKDKMITTGTSPVWLREDTWHFKEGSKAATIIRGMDEAEVSIVEVSKTTLKLTLEWDHTTFEPGRLNSLPGIYEFTLSN